MSKINIKGTEITILNDSGNDFISLTDMIKQKDGDFFITDWLRNKNTLDYISVWERLNNPDFNYGEFAIITTGAGRNSFKVSVKDLRAAAKQQLKALRASIYTIDKIQSPFKPKDSKKLE